MALECSCFNWITFLGPSSHEPQPEEDCLHELPEEVQSRRDESNTGTYQDLSLDTVDYTSMYTKIQDSYRPQAPTVARGGHVYAVVDPSKVEPPSQYNNDHTCTLFWFCNHSCMHFVDDHTFTVGWCR